MPKRARTAGDHVLRIGGWPSHPTILDQRLADPAPAQAGCSALIRWRGWQRYALEPPPGSIPRPRPESAPSLPASLVVSHNPKAVAHLAPGIMARDDHHQRGEVRFHSTSALAARPLHRRLVVGKSARRVRAPQAAWVGAGTSTEPACRDAGTLDEVGDWFYRWL